MNAAARAKAMLVDPAAAWAAIEAEAADPAYVLTRYVAVLALVPAAFSFIGASVIGVVVPNAAPCGHRSSMACSARFSATS